MSYDPRLERQRAIDDNAMGHARELVQVCLDCDGLDVVYRNIKDANVRALMASSKTKIGNTKNHPVAIETIQRMLAIVGFWSMIEAMERDQRVKGSIQ